MKLVDILARELKVWPEGVSKLAQSFAGMVFYQDDAQQIVPLGRMDISDDFRDAYVTRAEWRAAVDALNAPKVVEWDGKGNPPVGTVVSTTHKNKEITVKILAYGKHRFVPCVMAADMSHGFEGKMFAWILDQCEFMPIRTVEQVAAEEREKAIEDMLSLFEVAACKQTYDMRGGIAAIYDANYRKQVAK